MRIAVCVYIYIWPMYVRSFFFCCWMLDDDTAMPKHVSCIVQQEARDAIWLGTVTMKMSTHKQQRTSYQYSEPKVSTYSIICISDQHYVGKHCWNSDSKRVHLNVILTITQRFFQTVVSFQIFHKKYYMRFSLSLSRVLRSLSNTYSCICSSQ